MAEPDNSREGASSTESIRALLSALGSDETLGRLLAGAAHPKQELPIPSLAGDILHGADEIAVFLYGDAKLRRKVYNLIESGSLPHFRLGAGLCARKSVLLQWIAKQEDGGTLNPNGT
jgi:hypothetical protein